MKKVREFQNKEIIKKMDSPTKVESDSMKKTRILLSYTIDKNVW